MAFADQVLEVLRGSQARDIVERYVEDLPRTRLPERPVCSVYRSAALSHTSTGNYQSVSWDTEITNGYRMWTSSSATRLTVIEPGLYLLVARAVFAANATGIRTAQVRVNGTAIDHDAEPGPTASDGGALGAVETAVLSRGDYVELFVYQNSGGNLAYAPGREFMHFSAVHLDHAGLV